MHFLHTIVVTPQKKLGHYNPSQKKRFIVVSIEMLQRKANFEVYIEHDDCSFQVYSFDNKASASSFTDSAIKTFSLVGKVQVTDPASA